MVLGPLFGDQPTDLTCHCTDCCGRALSDFPAVIYGRATCAVIGIDIGNIPMYRNFSTLQDCSICGASKPYGVQYQSFPIKYIGTAAEPPQSYDEVCCLELGLNGVCHDGGECTWQFSSVWSGGESLNVVWNVTPGIGNTYEIDCDIDSIDLTVLGLGSSSLPACIRAGGPASSLIYTISSSATGGSAPEPCPYVCCTDEPLILYATVVSSCAKINGLVAVLKNIGGNAWVGVTTPGITCCPNKCVQFEIIYFHAIWSSSPAADCIPDAVISVLGSSTCGSVILRATGCPPYTLTSISGWENDAVCIRCCAAGSSLSIIISE